MAEPNTQFYEDFMQQLEQLNTTLRDIQSRLAELVSATEGK